MAKFAYVKLWLPVMWLLVVITGAIGAPYLGIADPGHIDFLSLSTPPDEKHWLGTDVLGRDILARVLYGARVSLTVGICAPAVGLLIGLTLGMLAAITVAGWSRSSSSPSIRYWRCPDSSSCCCFHSSSAAA